MTCGGPAWGHAGGPAALAADQHLRLARAGHASGVEVCNTSIDKVCGADMA